MEFLVVGLNHRTAPLQVRERLALTKSQLPEVLKTLGNCVGQGVIISTCNRSEVYTMSGDDHQKEQVGQFLSDYSGVPWDDIQGYLYRYRQEECIHHLFRVTSSLDSMILGEGQILRQVKDSFDAAVLANTVPRPPVPSLSPGTEGRQESTQGYEHQPERSFCEPRVCRTGQAHPWGF